MSVYILHINPRYAGVQQRGNRLVYATLNLSIRNQLDGLNVDKQLTENQHVFSPL